MSEVNKLTKSYPDTYLYKMGDYEGHLYEYLMKANPIDKTTSGFEDLVYEVSKRRVSDSLVKILKSPKVVLLTHTTPLPKSFKVFVAKDVRGDKSMKVFIDCTDLIRVNGMDLKCFNIDVLIAHLVSSINQMVYNMDPKRILNRSDIVKEGGYCFSVLFTHIVDYLYKISTMVSTKDKCLYLSTMYYMVNILGKDPNNETTKQHCKQISGIDDRTQQLLHLQMGDELFTNIKTFIDGINVILKLPKLTLDAFLEKWLFVYGTGTQFALELYPAFSTMITNAYVGCYLNNQKTIEKLVGHHMIKFSNTVLLIGGEAV